jgi:hypothetical protein
MNIIVLYVSSRSKSTYISTSSSPSNSVGKCRNSLLLNYLMHMKNDAMFDNFFVGQRSLTNLSLIIMKMMLVLVLVLVTKMMLITMLIKKLSILFLD